MEAIKVQKVVLNGENYAELMKRLQEAEKKADMQEENEKFIVELAKQLQTQGVTINMEGLTSKKLPFTADVSFYQGTSSKPVITLTITNNNGRR